MRSQHKTGERSATIALTLIASVSNMMYVAAYGGDIEADQVLIPGAHGELVVRAALARVAKKVPDLADKHDFLLRVALVESNFGNDKTTFRPGYNGGIWQVDLVGFQATKATSDHPRLSHWHTVIHQHFGLNWTAVSWSDLRAPLPSLLAARLICINVPAPIPSKLEQQAIYWNKYYNTASGKGTAGVFIQRWRNAQRKVQQDIAMGHHQSTKPNTALTPPTPPDSCPVGKYGDNCLKLCAPNCLSISGCDRLTGTCFGCGGGFWGLQCRETCPQGCPDNCEQTTGNCIQCSSPLLTGPQCDRFCSANCAQRTKAGCNIHGRCMKGCVFGFTGPTCADVCPTGDPCRQYGLACPDQSTTLRCRCPPLTSMGQNGRCRSMIDCETCKKYVDAAQQLSRVSPKTFETEEAATEFAGELACFLLPPPADLVCGVSVVESNGGWAIATELVSAFVSEGVCSAIGACTESQQHVP